jgi:hypothetical protein
MPTQTPGAAPASEPWLVVSASRQFPAWLATERVSLAVTTYQTGKLILLGLKPDGQLGVFERTFNRCMGLWGDGQEEKGTSYFSNRRNRPGPARLVTRRANPTRFSPPTRFSW